MVLELRSSEDCERFEGIVASNSMCRAYTLRLSCTFGAAHTSVEHFASGGRSEDTLPGALQIPGNWVRLGVGNDPVECIEADILMALDGVEQYQPPGRCQ